MNYFDSEHVYLALPSVFWYFWRDTASSLVPGGVWRVKRASFGTFPGLICRSVALERQSPERRWPGSQCHRVGSAFSTSGIPCRTSSFYFGFEGFCSSLPSPVVTMGFFFPNIQIPAGSVVRGLLSFQTGQTSTHSNDSGHRAKPVWQAHTFNNYISYELLLV